MHSSDVNLLRNVAIICIQKAYKAQHMHYELTHFNRFYADVRRIAFEQTDLAIGHLADPADIHHSIHEARKSFKRMRALLRLVRVQLPEEVYEKENQHYRDMGRQLSDLRDATSLLEALGRLKKGEKAAAVHQAISRYSARLIEQREQITTKALGNKQLNTVKMQIELAQKRIPEWQFHGEPDATFEQNIPKIFRQGARAMRQAQVEPTDEAFHEWRKRVKYMWYHLQLIGPLWPDALKPWASQFKQLANYLGDEHDITLVKEQVAAGHLHLSSKAHEHMHAHMLAYQQQLRTQALHLGKKLYAESPKAMGQRLHQYWLVATGQVG